MSDNGGRDAQAPPRKHKDAAYRSVGDEGGLVVLPGKAEVKVLNPVGSLIFSLIDGEHSHADIARAVHRELAEHFRRARVWGSTDHADGQWVGRDHVIADHEVIELDA